MTLSEAYETGKKQLQAAGIQEFELDAFYLLECVTGIARTKFYVDCKKDLADEQVERYSDLLAMREQRIPLQHLTGEQEFMGLSFLVNEDVLIPRQDTEIMVEAALEVIRNQVRRMEQPEGKYGEEKQEEGINNDNQGQIFSFLDMGTGSGCILLSIIKHGYDKWKSKIEGIGVDISEKALVVAKKNVNRIFSELTSKGLADEIKITLIHSDLFDKVEGMFNMIVSNPPYIGTLEFDQLAAEVRSHEPKVALDGGADGLWFYRHIIQDSKDYLLPGGELLLEIGATQGREVSDFMRHHGYINVKITKDLSGLDRVVQGQYHNMR